MVRRQLACNMVTEKPPYSCWEALGQIGPPATFSWSGLTVEMDFLFFWN